MAKCACEVMVDPPEGHLGFAIAMLECRLSVGLVQDVGELAFLRQLRSWYLAGAQGDPPEPKQPFR